MGAVKRGRRDVGARRPPVVSGLIGAGVFLAVVGAESLVHPAGYDPLRHTVSAFALGDSGWLQVANFLVSGVLVLAFAIGMRPLLERDGSGGRGVALLIGLVGLGLATAGVFPTDPVAAGATATVPYPPGLPYVSTRTVHGVLHDLAGTPVFVALPVAAAVVAYRAARTGRAVWAVYSGATASVFAVGFVLTSLALAPSPLVPPVGGLLQRATLVVGLVWLGALAVRLRRHDRRCRRTG